MVNMPAATPIKKTITKISMTAGVVSVIIVD